MFKIALAFPDDDKNFESVAARIKSFRERLPENISKLLFEFGIKAQATSKKDYLSGPRPAKLDVRTGRLRSSISLKMKKEGDIAEVSIGSNVKYASVHELGFKGTVSIPSFVRRVKSRDIRAKQFSWKNKSGTKTVTLSKGSATVRAHTRKVDIDARPFLRPAVEDNIAWLKQNLFGLGGSYGK